MNIKKNKRILATFAICLVLIGSIYILSNSTFTGELSFKRVYNNNTKEPNSIFISIIAYTLWWWVIGMAPASAVAFFTLILAMFLHRKDPNKDYWTGGEDDQFGFHVAFSATYLADLILLLLDIFSIIEIHPFG